MGTLALGGSSGLLQQQQQQQQPASVWVTHAGPAVAVAPTIAVGAATSPAMAQHRGSSAEGSSSPQGPFDALALARIAVQQPLQPQQLSAAAVAAAAPLLPQSSQPPHDGVGGGGGGDACMAGGGGLDVGGGVGGGGGGGGHVSVTDAWVAVEGDDVSAYLCDDPGEAA